ncbi:addiction module toxin, HicA family [Candidatus Poribacteria bacterium]|nr:addiction module toxin, HicA family [Candidatus Poribacteria bacterium]MYF56170.1 addiction module toxin, HicA family [Candidatus Poribacteria bacterium]MYI94637.1 addiction module toxin, HicA family [Candidatus Poribacteria bacterium]
MPRLSSTDWQTQVKIFEKFGCSFVRQKGSHLIYHHPDAIRAVVIPRYDEVPINIIRNNMRTVNLSREEYFRLLAES